MQRPPPIQQALLRDCVETAYALPVSRLTFLPLGADAASASYRVFTADGANYFLKLRLEPSSAAGTAALDWLASAGLAGAVAPLFASESRQAWTAFGDFTVTLYPYIDGICGWDAELDARQWREFGATLHGLHAAPTAGLATSGVRRETFAPSWRNKVASLLARKEENFGGNAAFAQFLAERRAEVARLLSLAERLASSLRSQPLKQCLCHGDIHAGNILVDSGGNCLLVDWDTLMLAPKERDLMFIGAGVGGKWKHPHETEWFYQGYAADDLCLPALAYYRCERILQDIGETAEWLASADAQDADGEFLLNELSSQFEPGNVVDIALATAAQAHFRG